MTAVPIAMHRAIELFGRGVAFGKSFTHPCRWERVGGLHVLRDAPRDKKEPYRNEEWAAHGMAPAIIDRIIRRHARTLFSVCVFRSTHEPAGPIQDGFRALGYRFITTEPLMVRRLANIPTVPPPPGFTIQRVLEEALMHRLATHARSRQMLPEHLAPGAPLRQYVALHRGRLVAWVGSVKAGSTAWCRNMYVVAAFRRRGLGRALMSRLLRDDRAAGCRSAFLVASHAGAKLYETVGYSRIGELLIFVPKRT